LSLGIFSWCNWYAVPKNSGNPIADRLNRTANSSGANAQIYLFFQFEILEELRREKIDDLATLIQKTYRGYVNRQKWHRVRDSQVTARTVIISHPVPSQGSIFRSYGWWWLPRGLISRQMTIDSKTTCFFVGVCETVAHRVLFYNKSSNTDSRSRDYLFPTLTPTHLTLFLST
jgi:hypothetical protein